MLWLYRWQVVSGIPNHISVDLPCMTLSALLRSYMLRTVYLFRPFFICVTLQASTQRGPSFHEFLLLITVLSLTVTLPSFSPRLIQVICIFFFVTPPPQLRTPHALPKTHTKRWHISSSAPTSVSCSDILLHPLKLHSHRRSRCRHIHYRYAVWRVRERY